MYVRLHTIVDDHERRPERTPDESDYKAQPVDA
jgi:hypothetical protein